MGQHLRYSEKGNCLASGGGSLRFEEGRDSIGLQFRNDVLRSLKIGYDQHMEGLEGRGTGVWMHFGK